MQIERWIERTLQIQAIPAPTFSEAARAAWMHHAFLDIGLADVSQDPIGNVFGRIPGGEGRPLLISAHLDTVFPIQTDLSIRRIGERLHGPGIGDNCLALATLLELADDFLETPPPIDILLVANVGEEGLGDLIGMRHVTTRFKDSVRAYLILEGMALGHIYHKGLPVRRFKINALGEGGHSWIHHKRPSAIHALVKIASQLTQMEIKAKPKTTLNIGRIQGGTSVNTIARTASLELDLRSEDEAQLTKLVHQVQQIVSDASEDDIHMSFEAIGNRPGGELPVSHPLIQAAQDSLRSAGVSRVFLEAGSTDANIPLSLGLPAICVGLTRGGNAHSMKEFIELRPMAQGYQALTRLIENVCAWDDKRLPWRNDA